MARLFFCSPRPAPQPKAPQVHCPSMAKMLAICTPLVVFLVSIITMHCTSITAGDASLDRVIRN